MKVEEVGKGVYRVFPDKDDYLIIYTSRGAVDIDLKTLTIDLNPDATASFKVTGYDRKLRALTLHKPERASFGVG
ncbi:hypothetical protein [Candidatus Hecatella orcuttiae]|uniref:hypothetical protein n=1 Tax=Candidatus Hecatella orcuttiae TaxID=1935119 RepID=UPI0028682D37|nr:hypothetical protein [Candidatus Hecatella orcuttiae]